MTDINPNIDDFWVIYYERGFNIFEETGGVLKEFNSSCKLIDDFLSVVFRSEFAIGYQLINYN